MADVTVRPATDGDIEQMVDAYMATGAERLWIGGEPPFDRAELVEKRRASMAADDHVDWVAEADGRIVGELGLTIWRGRADLGMLVIDGWRGAGVGSALLRTAIDWARTQDLDKIALRVWPHNERAIALYEKFGFEREGLLRKHYRRKNGEPWDAIAMGLLLR